MYKADEILKGSIDLHVHAAPDTIERPIDEFEVAEQARNAGMRAIVFKCADTITSDRAFLIRKIVTGIEVFGGICLNYPLGGLNFHAIEAAVKFVPMHSLTRIVWMPTLDAENHIKKRGLTESRKKGISILREGELSSETKEVLRTIREHDLVLATGHLSVDETKILVHEATKIGVEKIVATHVDSSLFDMSIEDQKELREMGAYLEHTFAGCMPTYRPNPIDAAEIAKAIKDVGASSCVMATDLGNIYHPTPVEGMRMFIHVMMKHGISRGEIDKMIKENPAVLLGMDVP